MKNILSTLVLLLMTTSPILAQITFEPGYYINNLGSKTDGFIKNIDWKDNPTEFEFKTSLDSDPKILLIRNVQEFGFPTIDKYVRATVDIDKSSNSLRSMDNDRNPQFEKEQLFLKLVVEGKASLLRYEKGNLVRYFYQIGNDSIKQLVYKRYLLKSVRMVATNERYKQQLLNDLKCSSISEADMKNLEYEDKGLKRIFIAYNTCENIDYTVYDKKANQDFFNLNLRVGLNNGNLSIQRYSPYSNTETKFGSKLGFRAGLEAEFVLPFNKNKWALIIEPTYQDYSAENKIGKRDAKVDYKSLELPIGVRYYFFLNDNSKIFVNASYVFDFGLRSKVDFSSGSDLDIKSRNNIAFGLGYKYVDRYSLEARYNLNRAILGNYINYNSDYNSLSLVLGYTLF